MKLRFLIPFLLALPLAAQTTRTAASSAESDVAATIALSSNGDTVQIPCSGTQTVIWTSQLQYSVSITLTALGGTPNTLPSQFGAGTNCLTIRDNVPLASGQMIYVNPTYAATNNVTTIQNMNIDPFSTSTPLWNPISIQGTGTTSGMPQARIDNIVFGNSVQWNFSGNTVASTQLIKPDNVVGVADHNTAPSGNNNELMSCQMSSLYGVGAYGDNSWAQPDSFGGSLAWFNENNSWTGGQTFQDCTEAGNSFTQSGGGRLVNRFNMIFGSPFQIASGHGTESTGRPRAYRHIEAYNNTLTVPASGNPQGFVSNRGGTILSHSNLAVMGSGAFMDQLFDITIFRRVFSSIPWGACGGLTTASGGSLSNTFPGDPWDTVDNTTYYTGTMSGVSSLTFTASGSPSWTTNQWAPAGAGYSVYDTTQGFVSEILSNTSNTLTINQNAGIGNSWSALANGDSFKIIRATVCQDQAGRGQGGYISGNPPTPSSALSQALDPVREWNDVIPASDVVFQYHTQFGGDILENRDYYTDEWKPGGLSGPTFQSSATVPFNGSTTCNNGGGGYTCGMGEGTLANRPVCSSGCITGVGYWATDQGSWNSSGQACTGNGAGAGQGCQGELFIWNGSSWVLSYIPYPYPHPLISGGISLAISTTGTGNVTGTNCSSGTYASGTTIGPCTANTAGGSTFTGWTGVSGSAACSGTTNPCPSFSITATTAFTAAFSSPATYTLSTATAGSGSGTISCTPSGSGIAFGTAYSCTLTAAGGSALASVTGCGGTGTTTYTGTMPASNCTVTGTFNLASTAATPVWNPLSGTYLYASAITLSSPTPTAFCTPYTWWGGVNPPTTSNAYNTQSLNNYFPGTLYAKVISCPGQTDSAVASVTYGVQALTPTFSPASGIVPQTVMIATATGGSVSICYRTDGGTPTATTPGTCDGAPTHTYSTPLPVTINPTTLTAIATEATFVNSAVGTATYSGFVPPPPTALNANITASSGVTIK